MLLSFRFSNHRSFRDEQQLNLAPIYSSDSGSYQQLPAVTVAGIFGANASGKSNLVSALTYMRRLVGQSDREVEPGIGLERQAFRLDPEIEADPSSYVVDLSLDSIRYTYGFIIDDAGIVEEWLHSYPLKRSRIVFERTRDKFRWGEETRNTELARLSEIVAPTALFLSVVARFGNFNTSLDPARRQSELLAPLHNVYSWIWLRQVVERPTSLSAYSPRRMSRITSRWVNDESLRELVVDLLRAADIGLLDVTVDSPRQLSLFPNPDEDVTAKIGSVNATSRTREPQLRFRHKGSANDVLFDVAEESSGTIRLLQSAVEAVPVLRRGGLIMIDEIDASLHPVLTAKLISLFQSQTVNRRGAQLVFTTHDASLLGVIDGDEVLRRDQVWFTQKNSDGTSELFPLSDFSPRKEGENRVRRYLSGNYGGVPDVSMDLFERALMSRSDQDA